MSEEYTPLMLSAMYVCDKESYEKGVKLLFNVNKQNRDGITALMVCHDWMYENKINDYKLMFLKLLLQSGANLELKDNNGMTAIMHYLDDWNDNNHVLVSHLIDIGADLNAIDEDGRSVLMHLAINFEVSNYSNEWLIVAEKIVKSTKDINLQDNSGMTALSHYCKIGYTDTRFAELLINNGASVDVPDNMKRTSLIYASRVLSYSGSFDLLELCLKNSKNIRNVDTDNNCALTYALENDHDNNDGNTGKIIKLFKKYQ